MTLSCINQAYWVAAALEGRIRVESTFSRLWKGDAQAAIILQFTRKNSKTILATEKTVEQIAAKDRSSSIVDNGFVLRDEIRRLIPDNLAVRFNESSVIRFDTNCPIYSE